MSYRRFMIIGVVITLTLLTACSGAVKVGDSLDDLSLIWKDYEKATYDFYNGDDKLAPVHYTIERNSESNSKLFSIEFDIELEDGVNTTGAVVDGETFESISSFNRQIPPVGTNYDSREMVGTYEDNKFNIKISRGDKEQKMSAAVPRYIIDNEASLMMIRNFPLEVGYSKDINIAIIATGAVAPYSVDVEAIETIDVPFGKVDCYRVVLRYEGRGKAPDIYVWYSADEDQIMVRYAQQDVRFDLINYEIN
ncbi:DUF3108 domain-containing protein [Alkaliphilus transvaalensis]|uniref:DUF3108 domain-containing protein n=1 Tax=Alkaliphilus transvaalensis TaxID=114628 RepID=UPI00047A7A66|nr:DUF3108 domain-containing protein [Alkaliphilus transvaalensis]